MRVATRISILAGSILLIFIAVVLLFTATVRTLSKSNRSIEALMPVRNSAAEAISLPDNGYALVSRYLVSRSPAPVEQLLEARAVYARGRSSALELISRCEMPHEPLSASDIRSSIPSQEIVTPPIPDPESLTDSATLAPGADLDTLIEAPLPTRIRVGHLDESLLDSLLCLHDHSGDPKCEIAHTSQKIIALWDALDVATAFHAALDPADDPLPLPEGTPGEAARDVAQSEDEAPELAAETARILRTSEATDDEFWSRASINPLFTEIKRGSESIERTLNEMIALRLNAATDQRKSTERIAITMTALAIIASLFFVWLAIRSFLAPVRELKAATQAVAEGQFRYKLDTSSRDEFSGLSASFNRMVTKIAELDQLKSEFLSHISHELRTPLAAMQETTNLLLDETPGPVTDKQRRLLQLTSKNCARLTSMITQLLDLSRMDRGVLPYEDKLHDFGSLIESVVTGQRQAIDDRGIELTTALPERPAIVRGDPDRLTEVIENLLTNAVKFSPTNGSIRLRLTHPTRDDHPHLATPSGATTAPDLLVSIADEGPGVPDLHKKKIFEKFHQVDRRPKGSGGGIGLGLAICREIIAAHDGEIWVEDNEASGSTFYFTLPASRLELTDQGHLI